MKGESTRLESAERRATKRDSVWKAKVAPGAER